jgi:hypothetical protein
MVALGRITFFVFQMLIPLIQANKEKEANNVIEERFFGWGSSQTVMVNMSSFSDELNQSADVRNVEDKLQSCTQGSIDLLYPNYKRLMIVIDDESSGKGQCTMAIKVYAHTIDFLDCNVPSNHLILWDGWKNRSSPDVSQIKDSCRVVSSSPGATIVPIEK